MGKLTYSETSVIYIMPAGSKVDPRQVLRSLIRQRLRQRHWRLRQKRRIPRQRHWIHERLRQRLQRHHLRLTESQTGTGESETESRQGQQILKPVQQRQETTETGSKTESEFNGDCAIGDNDTWLIR